MTDIVSATTDETIQSVLADFTAAIHSAQAEGRIAQVCITGGRIAFRLYQAIADQEPTAGTAVDWKRVELWWVDERFVAADSPDRNAEPALEILTGLGLDDSLVHPMPAADGADLDRAAAEYDALLADTSFDVCLLGMGPDGHCASLFPGHPQNDTSDTGVVAVSNSPKPPPERTSLTMAVINRSKAKFLLVTGTDKAEACARAHAEAGPDSELPVGRVTEPVWYLDAESAALLNG